MKCEDFKDWLAESRPGAVRKSPSASAHYESCAACRETADEEQHWQRLFGLISAPAPGPSLWPGIALAIRRRQESKLALSDALLLFSRRLAPAFAVLLVVAGGLFMWNTPQMEVDEGPMVAMLQTGSSGFIEEPDAILVSWVGAQGQ